MNRHKLIATESLFEIKKGDVFTATSKECAQGKTYRLERTGELYINPHETRLGTILTPQSHKGN